MRRGFLLLVVMLLTVPITVWGCGGGNVPQKKVVEVPMPKGVERAKILLQNYAKGQPLGSEVSSFPEIVEEAKKTDPDKAAILEQGLAELQKNPAKRQQIAQDLLKKL
ncbi:MAG: hypothetical protein NZ899_09565 [Thermoguttaceae bacterium]|nr:hypothetical protein [Thermoguttaceae bacterium]MDW8079301.1 hypothetical protein [Thermoguttaceae bacterium]